MAIEEITVLWCDDHDELLAAEDWDLHVETQHQPEMPEEEPGFRCETCRSIFDMHSRADAEGCCTDAREGD